MQGSDAVLERNGGGGVSIRRRWTRRGISYSYDAFGRFVAKAGRRAGFFRYRFYHTGLMRWLNRDPIEEDGGENLYAMRENSPCDSFDELGLWVATKESAGKSRRVYQVERGGCHRVSGRNIYHCGWQSDASLGERAGSPFPQNRTMSNLEPRKCARGRLDRKS